MVADAKNKYSHKMDNRNLRTKIKIKTAKKYLKEIKNLSVFTKVPQLTTESVKFNFYIKKILKIFVFTI